MTLYLLSYLNLDVSNNIVSASPTQTQEVAGTKTYMIGLHNHGEVLHYVKPQCGAVCLCFAWQYPATKHVRVAAQNLSSLTLINTTWRRCDVSTTLAPSTNVIYSFTLIVKCYFTFSVVNKLRGINLPCYVRCVSIKTHQLLFSNSTRFPKKTSTFLFFK